MSNPETFTSKTYGVMTFRLPRLPNFILRDENLSVPLTSFSDADIKMIFRKMEQAALRKKRKENHDPHP